MCDISLIHISSSSSLSETPPMRSSMSVPESLHFPVSSLSSFPSSVTSSSLLPSLPPSPSTRDPPMVERLLARSCSGWSICYQPNSLRILAHLFDKLRSYHVHLINGESFNEVRPSLPDEDGIWRLHYLGRVSD